MRRPSYPMVMVLASVVILIASVIGNYAYTRELRQHQIAVCESSNEARALNVTLWDYVLSLPPSRPRTQEQMKQIEDLKAFVRKTFATRSCSKI